MIDAQEADEISDRTKFVAEIRKMNAETRKYVEEAEKLRHESKKYERERTIAILIAGSGLTIAIGTVLTLLARMLHLIP